MLDLLTPDTYDYWPGDNLGADLLEASSRKVSDDLVYCPVSKAVSTVKNNSPDLNEPIDL